MNTNKLLVGGLIGGVAFFLLGWVLYGMLFGEMISSMMPNSAAVMRADADMDMLTLFLGNLSTGIGLAYIFEKWANIRSFVGGAIAAAIIGFLFYFGYNAVLHATTTLATWNGIIVDSLIYTFMSGIAGGAIGWWLGFRRI